MVTPYRQARIVTVKDGRAFLWIGRAETAQSGDAAARHAAITSAQSEFWDLCAFPFNDSLTLPEGLHLLAIPSPEERP